MLAKTVRVAVVVAACLCFGAVMAMLALAVAKA
jgi:hypothetical protein